MQNQSFSTIKAATEGGAFITEDRNTTIRPQDRYTRGTSTRESAVAEVPPLLSITVPLDIASDATKLREKISVNPPAELLSKAFSSGPIKHKKGQSISIGQRMPKRPKIVERIDKKDHEPKL